MFEGTSIMRLAPKSGEVPIHPYARISGDGSVRMRDSGAEPPHHLTRPIRDAHTAGPKILDVIGIQASFPLTSENDSSEDAIRKGMDTLSTFARARDKPIPFTELGYNQAYAVPVRPWDYEPMTKRARRSRALHEDRPGIDRERTGGARSLPVEMVRPAQKCRPEFPACYTADAERDPRELAVGIKKTFP